MSADIRNMLQQVEKWPVEYQLKLAQVALVIDPLRGVDPAKPEHLKTIRDASLRGIETAKEELAGPLKYWHDRAADYLSNAKGWAKGFLIPLTIMAFVLVVLLIVQPRFLEISRDNEKVAVAEAIQHVVIFGTIVASVFWGLRQVLRMWAYYDDMRADAVEREALLAMFAVMKGAGWLSDPDQTVILTALANRTRRSNVIGPEAPVTPIDALTKQLAETSSEVISPTRAPSAALAARSRSYALRFGPMGSISRVLWRACWRLSDRARRDIRARHGAG